MEFSALKNKYLLSCYVKILAKNLGV